MFQYFSNKYIILFCTQVRCLLAGEGGIEPVISLKATSTPLVGTRGPRVLWLGGLMAWHLYAYLINTTFKNYYHVNLWMPKESILSCPQQKDVYGRRIRLRVVLSINMYLKPQMAGTFFLTRWPFSN